MLSGPSLDFKNFVRNIKGDADSGIGNHANITLESLVLVACKKYLNMVALNEYLAIEPKDAQLMTLATELKALKEKYPDNPNKMNQEMMLLYKQYGVNPMGGCLPMLFQIPVFFGFYNMLQYAVELRNQPFLGWVTDLSQPDTIGHVMGLPINILPILMAVTMVIQMQITPKTGDKNELVVGVAEDVAEAEAEEIPKARAQRHAGTTRQGSASEAARANFRTRAPPKTTPTSRALAAL